MVEARLEAMFTQMRGEGNEKSLCAIPFVMQCSRRCLKLSLGRSRALSLWGLTRWFKRVKLVILSQEPCFLHCESGSSSLWPVIMSVTVIFLISEAI